MVAYTTTYNLKKPTVADDEDVWGGFLNDSMDLIDDVLDGTTPVTGIDINSGTLDNVVIGGTTANTGTFTVLSATTSLGVTGNITVSGTVDGVDIAARDAVLTSTTTTANAALPKAGGTMTGTITFAAGQSFDGRDVSADGSKLDGIEAGATADQTAAEILTAIKTVDGSTSGLDADLLDGQQGSYYLNTSTTFGGDVSGTYNAIVVADDSHNHVISNVDGLQTALDAKSPLANPDFTGVASFGNMITVGNSGTRLSGGTDLLEIYGPTASFHMGVQDGSGRVQMRWNASRGTNPTYQVSNEPSARYEILDVTSVTDSLWKIDHAGNGTAGSAISYSNILSLGTTTFTYNGNTVWHAGNDGAGSGLDADLWDGNQFSSYLNQAVLTTSAPTFGDVYNNGWFRNNQSGEGLYNQATTQHFYSDNDDWWNVAGGTTANGIRFRDEHNGTIRGAVYADSSNGIGFLDSDQQWAYRHYRDSRHEWLINNTEYMQLDSSGLFLHDGSLREDYDALSGTSPTCNVNSGGAFSLSMSGNTTFTFTSPTSGYSTGFVLQLTGNGGTVTWPASVDWAGGTAPDAPASGETDIYVFWTRDGGTTWYGVQSIDAAA